MTDSSNIDKNANTATNVIKMSIGNLMKKNYLNYAVSVIMDRALPDVRDGLKPVHRRILFSMYELKMLPGTAYKKSARMVGEVMGKYHPHGDSAIYNAAVYMAQPWSKRVPLIDGQGNFGSVDGDNPAAMRYTEALLTKAGAAFFEDIDKETVTFRDNYDGSEQEPEVLPVSYPNIWVNGVEGIAVGMATYLPPHNLNETIALTLELQKNPNLTTEEILTIMPAPDFPTGGIVHHLDGFRNAILTGKGLIKVRSKWHSETTSTGQELLILDELPFKVNKKELIEAITEKAIGKNKDSELEEISDIQDESNKEGIRVVMTLKKGAIPAVIFNHLVKKTDIEKSYNYNVMLLEGQSPKQMGLVEILTKFLEFRFEVIVKRVTFDLRKANERLHLLSGMMIVLAKLQEAIDIIMQNKDGKSANEALRINFNIDEIQAQAILDMKLQRLTGMEINNIKNEFSEVTYRVEDMQDILVKPVRVQEMVKKDLLSAKDRFGEDRRSEISYENNQINMSDLIKKEPCVIHVTKNGYLKRMPLADLESQKRNGKGRMGIQTSNDDYVEAIYSGSTHDLFMVFTKSGKALSSRVWNLPDGTTAQRGRHLRNIFESLTEPVANLLLVPEIEEGLSVITVTAKGKVKRTELSNYTGTLRKKGVQGVNIEEGDSLVSVMLAKKHDHIILVSSAGKAVRFEIDDEVLQMRGRKSVGVRGIIVSGDTKVVGAMIVSSDGKPMPKIKVQKQRLIDGNSVIEDVIEYDTSGMDEGKYLFCAGENGVGKKTLVSEFTPHSRGTKGVNCFNINEKTGSLVKVALVTEAEDLMMTTTTKTIRIGVQDVRVAGRNTAGTMLMNVGAEKLIDVIQVPKSEVEDDEENEELELNTELDSNQINEANLLQEEE
jgi:DNA gyrase subunit A